MNALSPSDKKKSSLAPVVGVVTEAPISQEFGLSAGGSLNIRIDMEVSGVTVVGSIDAKLQHRSPGGAFEDLAGANATVSITADGVYSITQNIQVAADQPNLPLRKMCRVALTTTNAGDEVTIDRVYLQQAL